MHKNGDKKHALVRIYSNRQLRLYISVILTNARFRLPDWEKLLCLLVSLPFLINNAVRNVVTNVGNPLKITAYSLYISEGCGAVT